MRLEREKIRLAVWLLKNQREIELEFQPLASLECFLTQRADNDDYCTDCRNYKTCETYLRGFRNRKKMVE